MTFHALPPEKRDDGFLVGTGRSGRKLVGAGCVGDDRGRNRDDQGVGEIPHAAEYLGISNFQ